LQGLREALDGKKRTMSRHPAPDELLLDYASRRPARGPALAVALHVALDPAAAARSSGCAMSARR
jgi:hypothetical protein